MTQQEGTTTRALPKVTLAVQHRMRPEVSELVRRTTYPELIDHPSTLHRPRVRGVARPVLFVTHNHLEMHDAEAADLGSKSRVNRHEVQMVCLLAKHLLYQQHSVTQRSIAILTPYLGQLSEIKHCLAAMKVGHALRDGPCQAAPCPSPLYVVCVCVCVCVCAPGLPWRHASKV